MKREKKLHEKIRKPTAPPTKVIQSRVARLREKEDKRAMDDAKWEVES